MTTPPAPPTAKSVIRVGFHSPTLGLRGTDVAMYDYAHFNETLLGNTSIILAPAAIQATAPARARFEDRFPVYFYRDQVELEALIKRERVDVLHILKSGEKDGVEVQSCRTVIHAVFDVHEPHGDVYAYVSHWLSRTMADGTHPYVPHMIQLPAVEHTARAELGIPTHAKVFGSIGGETSFDVRCAVNAVLLAANFMPQEVVFLFINTRLAVKTPAQRALLNRALKRGRIRYLPGTYDPVEKTTLINACDAMLHARKIGETFGIAIGEFAVRNKPILTFMSLRTPHRCHYDLLSDDGNYYTNVTSLLRLLYRAPARLKRSSIYKTEFTPEKVMQQFQSVFLES